MADAIFPFAFSNTTAINDYHHTLMALPCTLGRVSMPLIASKAAIQASLKTLGMALDRDTVERMSRVGVTHVMDTLVDLETYLEDKKPPPPPRPAPTGAGDLPSPARQQAFKTSVTLKENHTRPPTITCGNSTASRGTPKGAAVSPPPPHPPQVRIKVRNYLYEMIDATQNR